MSHGLVASDNSLGPSDHTFGLPDHDLEPQGRYRSHGPRLVRVVANDHYKYVRQARERYRMPMTFISILLACLLAFQCAYILCSYSIDRTEPRRLEYNARRCAAHTRSRENPDTHTHTHTLKHKHVHTH